MNSYKRDFSLSTWLIKTSNTTPLKRSAKKNIILSKIAKTCMHKNCTLFNAIFFDIVLESSIFLNICAINRFNLAKVYYEFENLSTIQILL